jgi:class 3 adenylate cyclase
MQGLALTRAAQDDAEAIALVVHDPTAPPGPGGVLTFIENWRRTRRRLRLINLADVRSKVTLTPLTLTGGSPRPRRTPQREVGVMLFADVAGFSGLPEPHLPAFFEAFLGEVAQELKASAPPLFQNTWGDGLYLVFADVVSCADFALRLLRRLERFNFDSFRFKLKEDQKPGVRIGLHTGPVFKGRDAIIDKENYFGSHVSRAARIEPVTAPGCAFCSEQFAAALAMAPGHDFVCEYLGMQPLAKEYDTCPLYRLTHREPGSPASQTGS